MKRFTDNALWEKGWFRKLPPHIKAFWFYLIHRCDNAGVWEGDFEAASFMVGSHISEKDMDHFGDRVKPLKNGKWFLTTFVEFQYGKLSTDCRAHIPVFQSIKKHNLSYTLSDGILDIPDRLSDRVSDRLSDSLKDKDKDKDSVILLNNIGESAERGSGTARSSSSQNSMPDDGWELATVIEIASSPDCGVLKAMAQACFDHYAAAEWHDRNGNKVGRTINSLKSLLRKWKTSDASIGKTMKPHSGSTAMEPPCPKCGWALRNCTCEKDGNE